MKQKFLVINCDSQDIEELRQRIGFNREIVPCPSIDDAARQLHSNHNTAVLVSVAQPRPTVNGYQSATESRIHPQPTSLGSRELIDSPFARVAETSVTPTNDVPEVDRLVARILEHCNGHDKTLAARVDLLERKIIEQSLNRNGQHRKETAAELGISRVTLYNKMKKFGLLD